MKYAIKAEFRQTNEDLIILDMPNAEGLDNPGIIAHIIEWAKDNIEFKIRAIQEHKVAEFNIKKKTNG